MKYTIDGQITVIFFKTFAVILLDFGVFLLFYLMFIDVLIFLFDFL